jgi:hypothetical protein
MFLIHIFCLLILCVGAIHMVVNNQIGFTAEANAARSTRYATDLFKAFEVPIWRASSPEAVMRAARYDFVLFCFVLFCFVLFCFYFILFILFYFIFLLFFYLLVFLSL